MWESDKTPTTKAERNAAEHTESMYVKFGIVAEDIKGINCCFWYNADNE